MAVVMKTDASNRILAHIIKHNPCDGEVYITWQGETYCGKMSSCEIVRRVDEVAQFSISGYIWDREK